MTPDPHPWSANLADLHAQIWILLLRGLRDKRSPARHPTLGTVSPDGRPQARTVVLRAAQAQAATLDIHTDLASPKIADLRATPFAALHIWDTSAHLQLRLEAEATVLTGPEVAEIWARVPDASRLSYGSTPAPGDPIPSALAYAKSPDALAFAVVRLQLTAIDALHLGQQHRRARFARSDGWAGTWLTP
jgi:pyridoxamine 5'-phosphate oxidase